MPQTRAHHSETNSLQKKFDRKTPEAQHLVWLHILGAYSEEQRGLNPHRLLEVKRGVRGNNPGSRDHFEFYLNLVNQNLLGVDGDRPIPSKFHSYDCFRSQALRAAEVAVQFFESEGTTLPLT